MSMATNTASVWEQTPPPLVTLSLLPVHVTQPVWPAVVQGSSPTQQKFPLASFSEFVWPEGQVPAEVSGVASVPLPTPAQGAASEQQKLPVESCRVPVFVWPAGQVPAAVSGLASVPVPTPVQGAAGTPHVTVTVEVVSEAG